MKKKKVYLNIISALGYELILVICDFIIPRLIISYYGSSVNGLVASITQFLGIITLMEMGMGAVIKSSLYKPLVEKNNLEISRIVKSSRNFFRKIGIVLIIYIIILCCIYRIISGASFENTYIIPLIIAISVESICQYFFGLSNQLLLGADQRAYIYIVLSSIAMLLYTGCSVVLVKLGFSIQIVKLFASLVLFIKPIGMAFYVKHHYLIDKTVKLSYEPIKQKWNGIAQHIASFVLNNTDVMVLTLFSTLSNVSVYNVYFIVVAGIKKVLTTATTGIDALFGKLYAEKSNQINKTFSFYEWIVHTGVCFLFSLTGILIVPFVLLYTEGVTDANYNQPLFGYLLTAAYGWYCIRLPYNIMVMAAGHYRQTQASAITEAIINMLLSIILVNWLGIIGVAIGTLIAMIYRSCYLAWYLSKNILKRPIKHFIRHIIIDIISIGLVVLVSTTIIIHIGTYRDWMKEAIIYLFITFILIYICNYVFYKNEMRSITYMVFNKRRYKGH